MWNNVWSQWQSALYNVVRIETQSAYWVNSQIRFRASGSPSGGDGWPEKRSHTRPSAVARNHSLFNPQREMAWHACGYWWWSDFGVSGKGRCKNVCEEATYIPPRIILSLLGDERKRLWVDRMTTFFRVHNNLLVSLFKFSFQFSKR